MELKFRNHTGSEISLTGNQYFDLINVEGQTTATSDISSVVVGGIDGDTANNVQAQPRTITLDLKIKSGVDVEQAKRQILKVIKLKKKSELIWAQNGKTVSISGIVESVDMPRWENGVMMQISLHCEQPFWEDIDYIIQEISEAISLHYFTDNSTDMLYFPEEGIPFGELDLVRTKSFYNDGDVAVGVEIEIIAYGTVTNPIIYSADGKYFGVGYGTGNKQIVMHQGDYIIVTTHKGNKTVKLNGVSVIGKVKPNSTWLQLEAGENSFSINSDDEFASVIFNMIYKQRYI